MQVLVVGLVIMLFMFILIMEMVSSIIHQIGQPCLLDGLIRHVVLLMMLPFLKDKV